MKEVLDIQFTEWKEQVKRSEIPVIVEFWHHRCPFCRRMEPVYAQIPERIGPKAKVTRMNVLESDENRHLAIKEGVMGTPTFKVYCKGRSVGELVGVKTLEELTADLEKLIKQAETCVQQSTGLEA